MASALTVPDGDLMRAVVAMTPARIIQSLFDVAAPADPAVVSLHLTGGQVLGGLLVSVGTDRGHEVAVLHDPHTGRLGYALLANVIAVEVANPEPFLDVITEGRLPVPGEEETSRLALQREFGPGGSFPVQVDWAATPSSGAALANLARLLNALRTAADGVMTDEMGQAAWRRVRVLRVEHLSGSGLVVDQTADALSVQADLAAALPRDLAAELLHKINAVL
jgi:hypothetical protein